MVNGQLFERHPHRLEIAPALLKVFVSIEIFHLFSSFHSFAPVLKVFVSIEMTGESVDEYMIYNYRRPMYKILKHLWKMPEHNQRLVRLAESAYVNIENSGK